MVQVAILLNSIISNVFTLHCSLIFNKPLFFTKIVDNVTLDQSENVDLKYTVRIQPKGQIPYETARTHLHFELIGITY